jgi:2-dehydro-3-deoxyglucarate aldolase/4-hydroxy-2-oxoheptanedioate aldolase
MGARLKAALVQGKLVRVFCVGHLCSPKMIEIIGQQGGYDAVWLDQEHIALPLAQIEEAARAAKGCGLDSFVRLVASDYAAVMRPLEAGAGGIMAAQVRSASQVEEIVRWAKFFPRGTRGFNSSGADGRYGTVPMGDYLKQANAETFVAIQIEHRDAVDDVEAIAAVKDVDVLFIGPADLTISMGIPGEWSHPRFWEAVERVARAAGNHGIHWAMLPFDASSARRCLDLGCRMLSLGMDVWMVQKGVKAFEAEYSEFFRV